MAGIMKASGDELIVYPILHFDPAWPDDRMELTPGVQLHQLTYADIDKLRNVDLILGALLSFYAATCRWGLVYTVPDVAADVAGLQEYYRQELFARTLMALRLTDSTPARAMETPVAAILDSNGELVDFSSRGDYTGERVEPETAYYAESMQPWHQGLFLALYPKVYEIFKTNQLRSMIAEEALFSQLDGMAAKDVKRQLVKHGELLAEFGLFSEAEIADAISSGGPLDQRLWRKTFLNLLEKTHRDRVGTRNRIAQALVVFDETQRLGSELSAYLGMFTVLESLFGVVGETDIAHKVSIRAARFLFDLRPPGFTDDSRPKGWDTPLSAYKEVKKLYNIRSKIVHGNIEYLSPHEIPVKKSESKRLAFWLARRCLQTVLLNPTLYSLYSEPSEKEEHTTRLENFFLSLELGDPAGE
jgi:hypothetical protein